MSLGSHGRTLWGVGFAPLPRRALSPLRHQAPSSCCVDVNVTNTRRPRQPLQYLSRSIISSHFLVSVLHRAAPFAMRIQAYGTPVRGSLERYRFGSASDHHFPKHKLSKSKVRVGVRSIGPSRAWEVGNIQYRLSGQGDAELTENHLPQW